MKTLKLEIMRVEDLTFTERRALVDKLHEFGFEKVGSFYRKEKISISFKMLNFSSIRCGSDGVHIHTTKGVISLYENITVIM